MAFLMVWMMANPIEIGRIYNVRILWSQLWNREFKSLIFLQILFKYLLKSEAVINRPIYRSHGSLVSDVLAVPFVFLVDSFQAVGMQFQCTYIGLDLLICTHRLCCARTKMSSRAASVMPVSMMSSHNILCD